MSHTPNNTPQLPGTIHQSSSSTNLPYSCQQASQNRSDAAVERELSTEEPAFICTICWQPQPPPAKPKLLGTSARIVCRECWRTVLDLSICWVCGECIVRGDEVVSLGWCFWHRACFGCLVCGTVMNVPKFEIELENEREPDTEEVEGGWGNWKYDGLRGRRRCVGVELEEIPLCNICTIETAGESRNQLLQRGIDAVSRFDGGLSRDRLLMMGEDDDLSVSERRRLQAPRRSEAKSCQNSSAKSSREQVIIPWKEHTLCKEEDKIPLLQDAAAMGESYNSEAHYHSDSEKPQFGHINSAIFPSILDPSEDTLLIPSETKQQPRWMDFLPNNIFQERERQDFCPDIPDNRFSCILNAKRGSKSERGEKSSALGRRPSWAGAGIQVMNGDVPTSFSSQAGSRISTPTGRSHNGMVLTRIGLRKSSVESIPMTLPVLDGPSENSSTASRISSTIESLSITPNVSATPQTEKRRRTTISFDPEVKREIVLGSLDEPSSRRKRFRTIESTDITTDISTAPPPPERTPFPRMSDPSIEPKDVDYFTPESKTAAAPMQATAPPPKGKGLRCQADEKLLDVKRRSRRSDAPSPEDHNAVAPVLKLVPPLPPRSSEYLERYKPTSPAPNPAIEKYIAKPPQPILEKMRRRRAVSSESTKGPRDFTSELESLFPKKQEGNRWE